MPCARCGHSYSGGVWVVGGHQGLLSGGAAGGATTTTAMVDAAYGLLPDGRQVSGRPLAAPQTAPPAALPALYPGPAVPQAARPRPVTAAGGQAQAQAG